MFNDLDYIELEVIEVALDSIPEDTRWLKVRPELAAERTKLLRKVQNELYKRDERHWADK